MCHEYRAVWSRSEAEAAKKRTQDTEPRFRRTSALPQDQEAKQPVASGKVEEKELEPAE